MMTVDEQIQFMKEQCEDARECVVLMLAKKNRPYVAFNVRSIVGDLFCIGLLKWRRSEDPRGSFQQMLDYLPEGLQAINSLPSEEGPADSIESHHTVYAAFLCGQPHPPVNLAAQKGQLLIDCFFGNVLLGATDIADWPRYRDALAPSKRHDLCRRTNELYAGLLAGTISAEDGVKRGEELWAEREDDTFFDVSTGGYGADNEHQVDFILGAILKKTGSTVPTVHAWRW